MIIVYIAVILAIWIAGAALTEGKKYRVEFILKFYDGWIGYYWCKEKKKLYLFFIPFFGVSIYFGKMVKAKSDTSIKSGGGMSYTEGHDDLKDIK